MDPEEVQAQQQSQSSGSEPPQPASTSSEVAERKEASEPSEAAAAAPPALQTPEEIAAAMQKQVEHIEAIQALSGKMEILDPNADPAQRKPNQVSVEEFNRLAEQYASIKRGDTDLQIDTKGLKGKEAAAFKDGTMNDIGSMMQTGSGRELLNAMSENLNPVTGEHMTTTIGAVDAQLDRRGQLVRDAGNAETVYQEDKRITDPLEQKASNFEGVDPRVKYIPGESAMVPGTNTLGTSSTILLHELNHAYNASQGTIDPGKVANPVGENDKNVDADEYQAVGLGGRGNQINGVSVTENAYRAERRALGDAHMENRESYIAKPLQ